MRHLTLALLSAAMGLVASAAMAADIPVKARPMVAPAVAGFEGFYVGVSAGWANGRTKTSHELTQPNCVGAPPCPIQSAAVAGVAFDLDRDGFTGGVQWGHNWRRGNFVYGVESDLNYVNLGQSATRAVIAATPQPKTITLTDSVKTNWVSTYRSRIGYIPTEKTLWYLTGGVAVAELKYATGGTIFSNGVGGVTGNYSSAASIYRAGLVLGGGFEYAWSDRMTFRVEYQHLRFGTFDRVGLNTSTFGNTDLVGSSITTRYSAMNADIVRAGLNWRL